MPPSQKYPRSCVRPLSAKRLRFFSASIAVLGCAQLAHADEADPIGNIIQNAGAHRVAYTPAAPRAQSEAIITQRAPAAVNDPIGQIALSPDVSLKSRQIPDALDALSAMNVPHGHVLDNPAPYGTPGSELAEAALNYLGVKYRYGGESPRSGFDCSGFIQYLAKNHMNLDLPRVAASQAKVGSQVSRSNLQPGDLIFFNTTGRRNSHVGIYLGDNQFVHAPRTGARVRVEKISAYWDRRYNGARRITTPAVASPQRQIVHF